jgi:uncharacterized protein (TIGR01244 family)
MTDSASLRQVADELPFGVCVRHDLVSAGQPEPEQFAALAGAGLKTVVDLRHPAEPRSCDEPEAVREAGLEYINIPVAGVLTPETFDFFREVMRDATRRPVLVHCASANRCGALLLPFFMLDEGADRETAWRLALQAGLRSAELGELALTYVEQSAG